MRPHWAPGERLWHKRPGARGHSRSGVKMAPLAPRPPLGGRTEPGALGKAPCCWEWAVLASSGRDKENTPSLEQTSGQRAKLQSKVKSTYRRWLAYLTSKRRQRSLNRQPQHTPHHRCAGCELAVTHRRDSPPELLRPLDARSRVGTKARCP